MTKFNLFEKEIIETALDYSVEESENEILEKQRQGKKTIFAPGYLTMTANEIKQKLELLTEKQK